ncbi:MAG: hypothetical protein ACI31M_01625 [Bacilli bacterium]
MEKVTEADFTINDDEIEKVNATIHKLRDSLKDLDDNNTKDKIQDEILYLLEIRRMLFVANMVDKPEEFILIDEMRIKKSDYDKFFEMLSRVNIEGLDIVKPLKEGEFLPGTKNKIKVPREIKENETIDDYEDYLYEFYTKNGYNLPAREYVEGTNVYKVRSPYIHECYTMKKTADGYKIEKASKNPYYRRMKKYYEKEAKKALDNINNKKSFKIFEGAYVSNVPKQPMKVKNMETIPMNLQFFGDKKSIMDTIVEGGKRMFQVPKEEKKQTVDLLRIDKLKESLLDNPTFYRQKVKHSIYATKPFLDNARESLRINNYEFTSKVIDKLKVVFAEIDVKTANDARKMISKKNPTEKSMMKISQLEQEHDVKYTSVVEEKFRIFDNTLDKIIGVSSGKSIEDSLPREVLVTFGFNAYALSDIVNVTPDYISTVIAANEHASAKYPAFASKFSQLNAVLNQKKKTIDSAKINKTESDLMDSFVPFDEVKGLKL